MTAFATSDRPMKILMVGSQMALAGAQRVLLSQAAWFYARGDQVTVAFFYDKQDLYKIWREHPFPVLDLEAWDLDSGPFERYYRLIRGLIRLHRLMRRGDFDIVEAYTPHSNILALVVAALARIPVRIASHHGIIEGMPAWLHRLHGMVTNSPVTTCMVAVSSQVKDMAIRIDGVQESKIVVINNGIEIHPLPDAPGEIRARIFRDLDIPPDSQFLLAVGRLAVQKGHAFLLDAAPLILEEHPNAVIAIAGVGSLEPFLRQQARRLGLEQKVIFLGNRNDIYDLYSACHLFLLPSLWEGLPIAMLEAMSQAVPVVAANVEGVAPVIEHGSTGMIIPRKDPPALADAVNALLNDPDLMSRIGTAGMQVVKQNFSIQVMCSNYLELFQRFLQH